MKNIGKLPLVLIALAAFASTQGCGPKRLTGIAQEDKDLSENQMRSKRFLAEGKELLDAGEFEKSQNKLLAALQEDPRAFEAHLQLGDLYASQGDSLSALAEYVAHTETAPKSRLYLDRMLVYVEAKFARNPSTKRDVNDAAQAEALLQLSKAVAAHRAGRADEALTLVSKVSVGLPRAGLVEYLQGHYHLAAGRPAEAIEAFGQSVAHNGYFARLMLEANLQKELPGLDAVLAEQLEKALQRHPSDAESALLLAVIHLRARAFDKSIKVIRDALSWGKPRWDMLFVKAVGHHRLDQKLQRDQALSDISVLGRDMSTAFSLYTPSLFKGLLDGLGQDLAAGELAGLLPEPAAGYFRWRLFEEAGDPAVEAAWKAFDDWLHKQFPDESFSDPKAAAAPERQPKSMAAFMGAVREQTNQLMPDLQRCDLTRRSKRGDPSGRLRLQVEIAGDGRIGQVALLENTTNDSALAYCVIRKVLALRFPKPLRKQEMFKMPVMFGPELDHLYRKDAAQGQAADPSGPAR